MYVEGGEGVEQMKSCCAASRLHANIEPSVIAVPAPSQTAVRSRITSTWIGLSYRAVPSKWEQLLAKGFQAMGRSGSEGGTRSLQNLGLRRDERAVSGIRGCNRISN